MLYHYDFHNHLSNDPLYRPEEAFHVFDAQTGQEIEGIISYDQPSGRLDRWAELNGAKYALAELREVRLEFPDRKEKPVEPEKKPEPKPVVAPTPAPAAVVEKTADKPAEPHPQPALQPAVS